MSYVGIGVLFYEGQQDIDSLFLPARYGPGRVGSDLTSILSVMAFEAVLGLMIAA